MTQYISHCVGCETCIGAGCSNREKVPLLTCDHCGEEKDILYHYEGDEVCADCILESLEEVEV